jgi:nickel transport protein
MDVSSSARSVILLVLAVGSGLAHDIEAAVVMAPPAVIVKAAYAGSEPVAFAKIQVFAPGGAAAEFQTGMTDRRGYFSFVPDGAGQWRVVVDDEEGHRREVAVAVPERFGPGAVAAQGPVSRFERALVGIALILGATGVWYGLKSRNGA